MFQLNQDLEMSMRKDNVVDVYRSRSRPRSRLVDVDMQLHI